MRKLTIVLAVLLCGAASASDQDIAGAPLDYVLVDYKSTSAPTSLTDICTNGSGPVDCWVGSIYWSNPTASSITLRIIDRDTTPFELVPTIAVTANSGQSLPLSPNGVNAKNGLRVIAGSTGLHLQIHLKRAP